MKSSTASSILVYCLLVVVFTACTSTNRKNHVVAIDNSVSVPETVVQHYIEIVEDIIMKLGSEDRLTLLLIDGCSQTRGERVYNIDLAAMDFTDRNDGINHSKDSVTARRQKYLAAQLIEFRNVIAAKRKERSNCRYFTDIISSLFEVAKLSQIEKSYSSDSEQFMNEIVGEKNFQYNTTVYIFSDMIQESSDGMDFKKFAWSKESDVEEMTNQLQLSGRVPSLNQVNVFVCGATASLGAGAYSNQQITNIRHFWELYLNKSGALLKNYGYDTRLEIARHAAE